MKNYLASMRMLVVLIGLALLAASCDDSEKAAAQPPVVKKKLAAPVDRNQPPGKAVAAFRAKPEAPASQQKPAPAQAEPPAVRQPAPAAAPHPTAPDSPPKTASAAPAAASPMPAPAPPAKPPTSAAQKIESGMAVTDDQVASLLNIQAPPPYNPKGKPDPFEPFIKDQAQQVAKTLKAKKRSPQTPLEQIDLGQLKLVAIVASPSGNRALVEQSSGKGYILKPGTYVGLNSGKVVEITIEKVMIEEEYEDVYGKTITQKKEITLPKPPGEL
jgi:type IV pilus assembly protein PilP